MAATRQIARRKTKRMPRPKLPVTKESRIDVRMHPALREALEKIARMEDRTLSKLCEKTMRQFAIDYLNAAGEPTKDIEELP